MATAGAITVQIHGLENLRSKLNSSRADGPIKHFLDRGSFGIEAEAKRIVAVDTGELRRSIGVESPTNRKRRIGPAAPHGLWVEKGTRPHWPPPGALSGWARRHGVDEGAIRRSIGKRGTKAQPFMAPAAETSVPFLRSLVPILAAEIESAFS